MFNDLDSTLKAILDDPAAPVDLRDADVSFETPDKNYLPGQVTVNLFLYEMKENRTLRDPQPLFVLENGQYARRQPPLRVDCAYLVTAWSNQNAALKVAEEHKVLGQALAWLGRFGTIPEHYFQGALAGQPYPPPTLVAQMDGKQNISEFWSAMGIAPRPAFTLIVTVALELGMEQPEGPEVVTHELRLGLHDGELETLFELAGTVRQAGSDAVVANAELTLPALEWVAHSDTAGRFRFAKLAKGDYMLQTTAPGFAPASKVIQVPGKSAHAYDITLTKA